MVAQTKTETEQKLPAILEYWDQLSAEHQQIVLQIAEAFARIDQQEPSTAEPSQANRQGLINLMQAWMAEFENATPEEIEEAERDWEDFKQAMNNNRLPGPPLFV